VYLFSDIMMYCQIKSQENYEYKGHVDLRQLLLHDTASPKKAFELIRMDDKKKKYIFKFKTDADKARWMSKIQILLDGWLDLQKIEQGRLDSLANLDQERDEQLYGDVRASSAGSGGETAVVSGVEEQPKKRVVEYNEQDSNSMLEEVRRGNVEAVKFLLEQAGADPFYVGAEGVSAACYASVLGLPEILQLLIEQSLDVLTQTTPSLLTPLHYASMNGHDECVNLILKPEKTVVDEEGAETRQTYVDIYAVDDSGLTALDHAVLNNMYTTFKLLDDRKLAFSALKSEPEPGP